MPLTFRRLRRPVALLLFVTAACGGRRPPSAADSAAVTAVAVAEAAPPGPPPPADLEGYRTDIDLVSNRLQAVTHRDGRLVTDAATPDFLKYIDGDWKTSWILGAKDGGKPAALVNNISSILFLPLDTDGDGAGGTALSDEILSFTCRALAPGQKVSIFANEKPAGTIEVGTTAKRYDV